MTDTKDNQRNGIKLTTSYLENHRPDLEFHREDFERMMELAVFGWEVQMALIEEAKNDSAVKAGGTEHVRCTLEFEMQGNPTRTTVSGGRIGIQCVAATLAPHHYKGKNISHASNFVAGHIPCINN